MTKSSNFNAFVAKWDESYGPTLMQAYPTESSFDYEALAIQFFMTFETVFGSANEKGFKKTEISLPITALEKVALIHLEVSDDSEVRGGKLPMIFVLLIPERIPVDKLGSYKEFIENTIGNYNLNKVIDLQTLVEKSNDIYDAWRYAEEESFDLETYSFTNAVNDFKSAISFFQTKNFGNSYPLLNKALKKFEAENNLKLIIESTYLLATIDMQTKRYEQAISYYEKVIPVARQLEHLKYLETSLFMTGFCLYKLEKYYEAILELEKIDTSNADNINTLQYHTILARSYLKTDQFDESESHFKIALDIANKQTQTPAIQSQGAQIYYDYGMLLYRKAIDILKKRGFSAEKEYNGLIYEAIQNIKKSTGIWEKLNDYNRILSGLKTVGVLYEVLGDLSKSAEYFLQALQKAEAQHDLGNKLKLIIRIIPIQKALGKWEDNLKLIESVLFNVSDYSFIDLISLSYFHKELGIARWKLKQEKFAVAELITALNTIKKQPQLFGEISEILKNIIAIYTELNEPDKVEYYTEKLNHYNKEYKATKGFQQAQESLLGPIKEIWIYTSSGIELFSYSPDSRMDVDLLGGFLTAIQQFGMELSKKQVKEIILGDERYSIYKEENQLFFIVGRSSIKAQAQDIEKTLEKIYTKFYKEYSKELDNFLGDVLIFKSFKDKLFEGREK